MRNLDDDKHRAEFLETVPVSARGIIGRALSAKSALKGVIKAKCLDCTHFDRDEIANCRVVICPLHAYRPFRPKGEGRQSQRKAPGNIARKASPPQN